MRINCSLLLIGFFFLSVCECPDILGRDFRLSMLGRLVIESFGGKTMQSPRFAERWCELKNAPLRGLQC